MDLLVDIGNTRIKWMYYISGKSLHNCFTEEVSLSLTEILDKLELKKFLPKRVLVCSVGSIEFTRSMISNILLAHTCTMYAIKPQKHAFGVTICYEDPCLFGVDRWLALLAAYNKYNSAVLLADLGSAVTLDTLDASGMHQGGLISLGIGKMVKSLSNCELLPFIDEGMLPSSFQTGYACNTRSAIYQGVMLSVSSLLNTAAINIGNSSFAKVKLVLTGGDAAMINPLLIDNWSLEPTLVFDGMKLILSNEYLLNKYALK
ncbi:type III pantothenate kinase [Thiomicrospira sp. R3]|uniref:type III pantothenate kinase n=1 Tax=Thiomicrospira sp. R3 TaxID=3035472 RepID=UPI00259B650B|nr:type III pantothenate kinase [Thiomicrospira sp. R3]WFE67771.1 type III pantothenate kinase [Thiomicrospira sp. R3]